MMFAAQDLRASLAKTQRLHAHRVVDIGKPAHALHSLAHMDPDRSDRLQWLLEDRRSTRAPFDPSRRVTEVELGRIVDAARWAPTAHNMQNYMLVAVDDPRVLAELGEIRAPVSPTFIVEHFLQLARSRDELMTRRSGILGTTFPDSWMTSDVAKAPRDSSRLLSEVIAGAPLLVVTLFDPTIRAPASEHDVLGMISLGCVLENVWLMAHESQLDVQVASAFAGSEVASSIKHVLAIPEPWQVAFALRIGHAVVRDDSPRVRRLPAQVLRRNRFA